jgi:hypothetical protein
MSQSFYIPEGSNGTAFAQDDHNLEMADTIDGLAQKNARTWQIIALVSLSSFFNRPGGAYLRRDPAENRPGGGYGKPGRRSRLCGED